METRLGTFERYNFCRETKSLRSRAERLSLRQTLKSSRAVKYSSPFTVEVSLGIEIMVAFAISASSNTPSLLRSNDWISFRRYSSGKFSASIATSADSVAGVVSAAFAEKDFNENALRMIPDASVNSMNFFFIFSPPSL